MSVWLFLSVCDFLSVWMSVSVCLSVCWCLSFSMFLSVPSKKNWIIPLGVLLHQNYLEKSRVSTDNKDLAWRHFYISGPLSVPVAVLVMTFDRWHETGDTWNVTLYRWQVTGDRWQVTGDSEKKNCIPPIKLFSLHGNGDIIRIGPEIQCLPYAFFPLRNGR